MGATAAGAASGVVGAAGAVPGAGGTAGVAMAAAGSRRAKTEPVAKGLRDHQAACLVNGCLHAMRLPTHVWSSRLLAGEREEAPSLRASVMPPSRHGDDVWAALAQPVDVRQPAQS